MTHETRLGVSLAASLLVLATCAALALREERRAERVDFVRRAIESAPRAVDLIRCCPCSEPRGPAL